MPDQPAAAATSILVKVWDLPTRLFHWALAVLVAFAWISGNQGWMEWHLSAGLAVLALLAFRLLWGVLGSDSARFTSFLRGPRAALGHLGEIIARRPDHDTSHNALGGYAVVLILAVLLAQAASGLFADDEILTTGPLAGFVPGWVVRQATVVHATTANLVLLVIALHLAAVLLYWLLGRNLVRAMLTGDKHLPAGTPAPRRRSVWLALVLLLLCAAAAQGIASLGG
jgi:cytochrome b